MNSLHDVVLNSLCYSIYIFFSCTSFLQKWMNCLCSYPAKMWFSSVRFQKHEIKRTAWLCLLQGGWGSSSISLCRWTVYSGCEVIWNLCSASIPNSGLCHSSIPVKKCLVRHIPYVLLSNSTNFKSACYPFMRPSAPTHITVVQKLYSFLPLCT
jgi:hypothetical protein